MIKEGREVPSEGTLKLNPAWESRSMIEMPSLCRADEFNSVEATLKTPIQELYCCHRDR